MSGRSKTNHTVEINYVTPSGCDSKLNETQCRNTLWVDDREIKYSRFTSCLHCFVLQIMERLNVQLLIFLFWLFLVYFVGEWIRCWLKVVRPHDGSIGSSPSCPRNRSIVVQHETDADQATQEKVLGWGSKLHHSLRSSTYQTTILNMKMLKLRTCVTSNTIT